MGVAWRGRWRGAAFCCPSSEDREGQRLSVSVSVTVTPFTPAPSKLPTDGLASVLVAKSTSETDHCVATGMPRPTVVQQSDFTRSPAPLLPAPCSLPGLQHNAKWSREVAECSTPLAGATYLLGVYLSKVLGLRLGQLRRLGLAA